MYQYSIIQWILFFFTYCFVGWVWETSYVSVRKREFINRGFLAGPFIPIYGFGVITMLLVTIPVKDNLMWVFILGMIAATVLEYVTGCVMEAIFKVRYWDYSNQRFNLNGHICLTSSIGWGASAILIVRIVHVPISELVLWIPDAIQEILAVGISVGLSIDFALSIRDALDIKEMLQHIKENNEEVQKLQRRMDVLIAVLDDEKQNLKVKMEQIMERRQTEERGYVGRAVENLRNRFDIVDKAFNQFDWKAKETQAGDVKQELEGLREKLMLLVAKVDLRKSKIGKHTADMLRRNPNAISKEYADELDEMKKIKNSR